MVLADLGKSCWVSMHGVALLYDPTLALAANCLCSLDGWAANELAVIGGGETGASARRTSLSTSRRNPVDDMTQTGDAARSKRSVRSWLRSPHRIASWLLIVTSAACLSLSAGLWSALVPGRWLALCLFSVAATFVVLFARGQYRVNMAADAAGHLSLNAVAAATGVCAALIVVVVAGRGQPTSLSFVGLVACLFGGSIIGEVVGRWLLRWQWSQGRLRSPAVVFGSGDLARELAVEINTRRDYGVDVVGFIADTDTTGNGSGADNGNRAELPGPVFSADEHLPEVLGAVHADRLIIGPAQQSDDGPAQRVARMAAALGLAVHVVPRFHQMGLGLDSMSPDRVRGYPLVRLQRSVHPQISVRLKRLFDVVVASTLLVITAPLFLLATIAVKVSSPGPALFAQERVGQGGRTITIRKFRTMFENSQSDTEWNAEGRVTPLGRLLRRLNIDELPQLLTIVRGDMSLVGPRPERRAFVNQFRQNVDHYDDRHRMPVGLTGLAQVVGLRGDTSIAERVKYDNLYIDQWSFRGDIEILIKTVTAVLWQETQARKVLALEEALQQPDVPRIEVKAEAEAGTEAAVVTLVDQPGNEQPLEPTQPAGTLSPPPTARTA